MNDITRVQILDRLAHLIEPLDDLGHVKGLDALLANALGQVAIAAVLHQQAHVTIDRYSFDCQTVIKSYA